MLQNKTFFPPQYHLYKIRLMAVLGRSSAPHLHYEIFKDKVKINPINFYYGNLTAKEYDELLKQASVVNQSLD